MQYPRTSDELKAAGYKFNGHGVCKNCGGDIEWWKTPKGKSIPMNGMERGSSPAVPHWNTCEDKKELCTKQ